MEHFFQGESSHGGDSFWYGVEIPVMNQSAFVPYLSTPRSEAGAAVSSSGSGSNPVNMNKKMIEFMRRSCPAVAVRVETSESEGTRCHRHMMNERLRREREKQALLALHSILPYGTKGDKKSIMQMAARRIQELKTCKEELKKRNSELEARFLAVGSGQVNNAKIKVRIDKPASGVDSIIEALKCLNGLESKTTSIRSMFSDQELVAEMEIETKIEAEEVEMAVQRTLHDVERKLQCCFREGYRS